MTAPEILAGQDPPASALDELQNECRCLRTQITALLISMLVLALSVNALLFYQVRGMRRQLGEFNKAFAEYQDKQVPIMDDFSNKLRAYARSHPDFSPILNKFFSPAEAPPAKR